MDIHLHCWGTWRAAAQKLADLRATRVRYAVSQVGDSYPGAAFAPALRGAREEAGRILYFFGLDFRRLDGSDWPDYVRRKMDHDVALGGRGLKIFKDLGLAVRDRNGHLVRPDDARLAPVWQAAAERRLPVLYHVADPLRSFAPIGGTYEELRALDAPALRWKWAAPGHPTHEELIAALDRLVGAYPGTTFIVPHLASLDHDLARCGRLLAAHPNLYADTAARLISLGRQPEAARALFLAHPGRILFGTDLSWPNQGDGYRDWFRLLETRDEAFTATSFGTLSQPLYGLGLPDDVLRQVYGATAARLLDLDLGA